MLTTEIEIDGEIIVFEYHHIPDEPETGFRGSLEITEIYENDVELTWDEMQEFLEKYDEDKIKEMIFNGSTTYKY